MNNTEIQVGEYIRTKNGSIFKIVGGNADDYLIDVDYHDLQKIEDDIYDELMWLNYNDNGSFIRQICKKHDFDIIKLIEKGDYVNGMEVDEFDDEDGNLYLGFGIYMDCLMDCIEEVRPLNTVEIKSIVTKEQFKAMEYKVGGEKC